LIWLNGALLRATNGFHQEKDRFGPDVPTIVCDHCDCIIVATPRSKAASPVLRDPSKT
jgi:hypothetical protein